MYSEPSNRQIPYLRINNLQPCWQRGFSNASQTDAARRGRVIAECVQGHSEIPAVDSLIVSCPREFATLETIVGEPAKKKSVNTEGVENKSTMLTVQVLWACQAFNATPEEAAQQVVADLFNLLVRGGSVSVHVEELGGKEYTLEVTARRQ
jgi:hypothetical protein